MNNSFDTIKKELIQLDDNSKLEITSLLIDDLLKNNFKSSYSSILSNLLVNNTSFDKAKIFNLIDTFEKLNNENKKVIINNMVNCIKLIYDKYSNEKDEKLCSCYGHEFSDWREVNYQTSGLRYDKQGTYIVQNNHCYWTRTCKRCGYYERVEENPMKNNINSQSLNLSNIKKLNKK